MSLFYKLILLTTIIAISIISCRKDTDSTNLETINVYAAYGSKPNDTTRVYFVNIGHREETYISIPPKHAKVSTFVNETNPDEGFYMYVPKENFVGLDSLELRGKDLREKKQFISKIYLTIK